MADFRSRPSWRTPASERLAGEAVSPAESRAVLDRERELPEEPSGSLAADRVEKVVEEAGSSDPAVSLEESDDLDPIAKAAMATKAQTRWTR